MLLSQRSGDGPLVRVQDHYGNLLLIEMTKDWCCNQLRLEDLERSLGSLELFRLFYPMEVRFLQLVQCCCENRVVLNKLAVVVDASQERLHGLERSWERELTDLFEVLQCSLQAPFAYPMSQVVHGLHAESTFWNTDRQPPLFARFQQLAQSFQQFRPRLTPEKDVVDVRSPTQHGRAVHIFRLAFCEHVVLLVPGLGGWYPQHSVQSIVQQPLVDLGRILQTERHPGPFEQTEWRHES